MAFYKCISNDIFCQKIEIIYSVEETRELMYKITSNFKVHLYNIFWQYSELRYLTCNLDNNGAILSVHFSGNYKNKQQSKIQYTYFGHEVFSFLKAGSCVKGNCQMKIYGQPRIKTLVYLVILLLLLLLLPLYCINYGQAHHFKAPHDGIGGSAKSIKCIPM